MDTHKLMGGIDDKWVSTYSLSKVPTIFLCVDIFPREGTSDTILPFQVHFSTSLRYYWDISRTAKGS